MNSDVIIVGAGAAGLMCAILTYCQAGVKTKPTLLVLTGSLVVLYGNLVFYPGVA